MIIDTHCHIGLFKYEPLESLLYFMETNRVAKAVFIQYAGNTNNAYLVESLKQQPGRFAAAMIVPPDDDGSAIRQWSERGIGGIRLAADFRGSGANPLAHWKTANELDLVVSAPSNPSSLLSDEFAEVLRLFPNLQIVIEHLAGFKAVADQTDEQRQQVFALARHDNLTIKLPGFGEMCDIVKLLHEHSFEESARYAAIDRKAEPALFDAFPPLVDQVLEAFGPARTMWGSDWPPVSTREGYASALRIPQAYLSALGADEQAAIFGGNAARIWELAA